MPFSGLYLSQICNHVAHATSTFLIGATAKAISWSNGSFGISCKAYFQGGIVSSALDQDVIDTMLNSMIHILLVNAMCKRGYLQQHIQNKITSVIALIILSQNNFKLNSFHFENMFSHGYVGVDVKYRDDKDVTMNSKSTQKESSVLRSGCNACILVFSALKLFSFLSVTTQRMRL